MSADQAVKGGTSPRYTPGTKPARRRKPPCQMVYVETHVGIIDGKVVPVQVESETIRQQLAAVPAKAAVQISPAAKVKAETSPTAQVRRELVKQLRWAAEVVRRLPGGMERKWLGGYEPVDISDAVRALFAPREVSQALTLFDLPMVIDDPFIRRVVFARMAGIRWEKIGQMDHMKRSVRRLQQLHDEGVNQILVALLSVDTKPIA